MVLKKQFMAISEHFTSINLMLLKLTKQQSRSKNFESKSGQVKNLWIIEKIALTPESVCFMLCLSVLQNLYLVAIIDSTT